MKVVETLDGTTFELTVMDGYSGMPQARHLVLRGYGVSLRRVGGKQVWSYSWPEIGAVAHDATNVWLVGPNEGFLASVDPMQLPSPDLALIRDELIRYQQRYSSARGGGGGKIDARILFLRDQARSRNK